MKTNKFELPELSKRKIKSISSQQIGWRKEGVRVQYENIQGKHIVHNYGQGQSEIDLSYGSAFITLKAMMIKVDLTKAYNVAVLGDNINAILTSIELIKRGFKIVLYTPQQFKLLKMNQQQERSAPRGYSLWFPDGYDWQEDLLKHELFSKYSYDFLQECIRYHRYRSIKQTSVIEFNKSIEQLRQVVSDLVFDNYRDINLDYGNGQHEQAVAFNTIVVDNSLYYEELKTELVLRGGRFATKKINKLDDVLSLPEEIVINCLGPHGKAIFPDDLLHLKQSITVDLQALPQQKGIELNVRLHLEQGQNYEIVERNGNIKIKLPPKSNPQESTQSFIQKHLFKIDAFFKTRRTQTAKL